MVSGKCKVLIEKVNFKVAFENVLISRSRSSNSTLEHGKNHLISECVGIL